VSDIRARRASYYEASYQPAILPVTGATAGTPGTWTPAGQLPPASPAALAAGNPVVVKATPATPWTTGQYVQTATAGVGGRASWTGTNWVSGAAP
jgi:acyl-CoA reductase-like NAD-dependent aldehyde dehydrogenase